MRSGGRAAGTGTRRTLREREGDRAETKPGRGRPASDGLSLHLTSTATVRWSGRLTTKSTSAPSFVLKYDRLPAPVYCRRFQISMPTQFSRYRPGFARTTFGSGDTPHAACWMPRSAKKNLGVERRFRRGLFE